MKKTRFSSILVILLLSIFSINALEVKDNTADSNNDLIFLDFYFDIETNVNKISYEINNFENFQSTDKFILNVKFNGDITNDRCENNLDFDDSTFYRKLTCEIKNYGDGNYDLEAQIKRGNEIIEITNSRFSLFENVKANVEFENLGDKSIIYLNVEGEGENLKIINTIPKEVIEILNSENKRDLIESEFKYEILEEDPVIAWSVDRAPAKINYTIKSKSSNSDLERIEIDITSNSKFEYLVYLVYVLIILILYKTFKPLFKKKGKKNVSKK